MNYNYHLMIGVIGAIVSTNVNAGNQYDYLNSKQTANKDSTDLSPFNGIGVLP